MALRYTRCLSEGCYEHKKAQGKIGELPCARGLMFERMNEHHLHCSKFRKRVSSMELMRLVDIDVDRNNLPEYIRDICEENQSYKMLELSHQAMFEGNRINTEFWDITYDNGYFVTFIKVLHQPWNKSNPINQSYVTVSHKRLKTIMEAIK